MDDISEFLPVKLKPGFIAIAFHLGCLGCNFCSVRYGNSRDVIFRSGLQRPYPLTAAVLLPLLRAMPAFCEARIPIRLGNDTDLRFEFDETIDMLDALPGDYPAAVLTRFPVSAYEAAKLSRPNVIVKFTATASSQFLTSPDNAREVVDSVAFFNTPVLMTIGPVTADNFAASRRLLYAIPRKPNVSVYIKALNSEFHPSLQSIPAIDSAQYATLKKTVAALGFRHVSQLSCPINEALGIVHNRVCDVPADEREYCERCAVRSLCYSPDAIPAARLRSALTTLGLDVQCEPVRRGFKSWIIDARTPTAFGDESFVSAILGCKVKFAGTAAGTGSGAYAASREVLARWQRVGFYPYDKLLALTGNFIEESMYAAAKGGSSRRLAGD